MWEDEAVGSERTNIKWAQNSQKRSRLSHGERDGTKQERFFESARKYPNSINLPNSQQNWFKQDLTPDNMTGILCI